MNEETAAAIQRAIDRGQTAGAVCLIGRGGETLCHLAVGNRSLVPERLPMRPDTIFDVASLTKVVATTTVLMQLADQGALDIGDEVGRWLPHFTGEGRERVTIRHLLTHSAGLPAHVNYANLLGDSVPPRERRRRVVEEICRLSATHAPDESAIYSCLGFILVAAIIERATGDSLADLAHESVFKPLGMRDTCFCPPTEAVQRCAATEQLPEGTLFGVVHDENARYLGGVSGNAGLFSTAQDLARFANMLLAGGELDGARIMRAESVEMMLAEQPTRGGLRRCLGWRMANADDPWMHGAPTAESVGHTGYTGTSLWIERTSGLFAILLANRVHLGRDADIEPLRREVGEIAAQLTGVQM